jgi:uncharacterized protein (TIGR03435 family)
MKGYTFGRGGKMKKYTLLAVGLYGLSFARAQAVSGEAFEVASIKSHDQRAAGIGGIRGGPGTRSPGQITAFNVTLRDLVVYSYSTTLKQMTGPDWLPDVRFDIVAKVPPGATPPQAHLMMQALLKDRLDLRAHWETREMPVYALTVGKAGLKVSARKPDDPMPKPSSSAGGISRDVSGGQERSHYRETPEAMTWIARGESMTRLAEVLKDFVDRNVVDLTKLKGQYDFELTFANPMVAHPMPSDGVDVPQLASAGPSVFSALEMQLGLKLEARTYPIEMLIIDGCSKVPRSD